jgi:hypothetical protein
VGTHTTECIFQIQIKEIIIKMDKLNKNIKQYKIKESNLKKLEIFLSKITKETKPKDNGSK